MFAVPSPTDEQRRHGTIPCKGMDLCGGGAGEWWGQGEGEEEWGTLL